MIILAGCTQGSAKQEKIVTLTPNIADIVEALDAGGMIVMTDINTTLKDKREVPQVDGLKINAEEVVAQSPTVVFAPSFGTDNSAYEPLEKAGLNVIYVPTGDSIESIYTSIEVISKTLAVEDKGTKLTSDLKKQISDLTEEFKVMGETKPKVYFEIAPAPQAFTVGSNTFINEMIEIAGGENVFADKEGYFAPTQEEIITRNPDIIITNKNFTDDSVGDLKKLPGYEKINAVKNNRVYLVDTDKTSQPSTQIPEGIKEIANAINKK